MIIYKGLAIKKLSYKTDEYSHQMISAIVPPPIDAIMVFTAAL